MKQIITESNDPPEVASPIGNKLVNAFDVIYTPGILTSRMDARLCMKDSSERPHAQKYPLKLKWIPAKIQSMIYPLIYWEPSRMTLALAVNNPTTGSAMN